MEMPMQIHEIKNEVLAMKAIERVLLAELILDSLDKPDMEIEKKWVNESEKRYKAYKTGKIKGIELEEVKKRFDK
jgi:putative addiction module component (TIGR02574 family)